MGFSIRNRSTTTAAVRAMRARLNSPLTQGRSNQELKPQAMDRNHRPEPTIFWEV